MILSQVLLRFYNSNLSGFRSVFETHQHGFWHTNYTPRYAESGNCHSEVVAAIGSDHGILATVTKSSASYVHKQFLQDSQPIIQRD